jgi:hypothetical protein
MEAEDSSGGWYGRTGSGGIVDPPIHDGQHRGWTGEELLPQSWQATKKRATDPGGGEWPSMDVHDGIVADAPIDES